MKARFYPIAITMLCIIAILLVIMKVIRTNNEEALEANYNEHVEEENAKSDEDEENGVELLEIGEDIRVLIKNNGYEDIYHEVLEVSATNGLKITYEDGEEYIEDEAHYVIPEELAAQVITIEPIDSQDKIVIHSLERGYGTPEYAGILEVFVEEEGIVIVNELSLERYLCGVLPSEMPASYEMEALKAQAVCARSYAYKHMAYYGYADYEAHVDDSTGYQVYNNAQEYDTCNQAIAETANQKLALDGAVVTTYFFSTSSGYTTDVAAWGIEEIENYTYLQSVSVSDGEQDFEEELAWYAWEVTLTYDELESILKNNLKEDFGELVNIEITEYGSGGVALALEVIGDEACVVVETEYDIREALGSSSYSIERQDGSTVQGSKLLPSAFITIENEDDTYLISGGGYGHGIGMSQNGANEMAKSGYDYVEILQFFYKNTEIIE